jgi:hypothetical protein
VNYVTEYRKCWTLEYVRHKPHISDTLTSSVCPINSASQTHGQSLNFLNGVKLQSSYGLDDKGSDHYRTES